MDDLFLLFFLLMFFMVSFPIYVATRANEQTNLLFKMVCHHYGIPVKGSLWLGGLTAKGEWNNSNVELVTDLYFPPLSSKRSFVRFLLSIEPQDKSVAGVKDQEIFNNFDSYDGFKNRDLTELWAEIESKIERVENTVFSSQ